MTDSGYKKYRINGAQDICQNSQEKEETNQANSAKEEKEEEKDWACELIEARSKGII